MRYVLAKTPRLAGVEIGATKVLPRFLVDMEKVRADLTIEVKGGIGGSSSRELWTIEADGRVSVPRNYQVKGVDDARYRSRLPPRSAPLGEWGWVTAQTTYRNELQRAAAEHLTSRPGDKVIVLGCGRGKTCVSLLAMIEGAHFPALVVVPDTGLADQWVDRIEEHTNIAAHQIGRVTTSKPWDCLGKPISVVVLNTAAMGKLPVDLYRYFRVVVYDEAHVLGAELLGRASTRFEGERWALTATEKRDDGAHAAYLHHTGPVVFRDSTYDLVPVFCVVKTGVDVRENGYEWKGRLNTPKLYNGLSKHKARNELILKWLVAAGAKGRTVLVLSERLAQLQAFEKVLKKAGISCGFYTGRDVAGGEKKEALRARRSEALNVQVTLATSKLAQKGLDRAAFDTVVSCLAFGGIGRLEQSAGRSLRELADKKEPWVVVFVDNGYREKWDRSTGRTVQAPGFLSHIATKMTANAQELGYKIKTVGASHDRGSEERAVRGVPSNHDGEALGQVVRGGERPARRALPHQRPGRSGGAGP